VAQAVGEIENARAPCSAIYWVTEIVRRCGPAVCFHAGATGIQNDVRAMTPVSSWVGRRKLRRKHGGRRLFLFTFCHYADRLDRRCGG